MFSDKNTEFIKPYFKLSPKGKSEYQQIERLYHQKMAIYVITGTLIGFIVSRNLLPFIYRNLSLKSTIQRRLNTAQIITTTGLLGLYGYSRELPIFKQEFQNLLNESDNVIDDY